MAILDILLQLVSGFYAYVVRACDSVVQAVFNLKHCTSIVDNLLISSWLFYFDNLFIIFCCPATDLTSMCLVFSQSSGNGNVATYISLMDW